MLTMKMRETTNSYRRLDYIEQGEFHRLVHEWQPKTA